MRILLINPPIREYAKPCNFPLGLGYLASSLLKAGHTVNVLDVNGLRLSRHAVVQEIEKADYDLVGITGLISQYVYIQHFLVDILKKTHSDKKIVVGGGIVSPIPKLFLENGKADIAVVGEGEKTIVELCNALETDAGLSKVAGIWYKKGKESSQKIIQNVARDHIENLDEIPYPAWNLFPMNVYLKNNIFGHGNFKDMNILATRGCPFNCGFCVDVFGKKTRQRTIGNILGEIKELKKRYGVSQISFSDETFTLKRDYVLEFCSALIKERLNITWTCDGRVNLMDEEMLRAMKRSGCRYILYGIESGNQGILDRIGKAVTVEQAERVVKLTKKSGIEPVCSLIIGYPGESKKSIADTVRFCRKTGIYAKFFYITPTPGSRLYKEVMQNGLIKDEIKYLEALSSPDAFGDKIIINLTEFNNSELRHLKKSSEHAILISFLLKNICRIPAIAINNAVVPFLSRLFNK